MTLCIEYIEGKELANNSFLLNQILDIYLSNNNLYNPTLLIRKEAKDLEDLRNKLLDTILETVANNYGYYILKNEGYVVGFNNHYIDDLVLNDNKYRTLYIGTSSIHLDYQNKGYGKQLYEEIENDLNYRFNVDAIRRVTWSTNSRQLHLYSKFGYKEYYRIKNVYGTLGVDSLHFIKIIKR